MARLKINRGTTYTRSLQFQRNGVAESLVGSTVRFTAKTSEYDTDTTDATAAITKNVTDGNAQGEANIVLAPADTSELAPGKYYYDIKVKDASGNVYKVDEGTIQLDASPTNRLS